MPITSLQLRLARNALRWPVRHLAAMASLATDTITRAERDAASVSIKVLAALQKAFEEQGIEFLPDLDTIALHPIADTEAIAADPEMPAGTRRIYPRITPYRVDAYEVVIMRLPLPSPGRPSGAVLSGNPAYFPTEEAAINHAGGLIQAGYDLQVIGPRVRLDRDEIIKRLNRSANS